MNTGIFLLLGTNLGNKAQNLHAAREKIEMTIGRVLKASSVYKTAAWGKQDQPEFYNQVISVETELSPALLLEQVLAIEHEMKRKREEKWGPRIIDIDILFYHDIVKQQVDLILPHPGISSRRFVLEPLAEIAATLIHPVLHKSIQTLLTECPDTLLVERITL
ncbi:MAG: 2-amino-4-hydroxy-6-hydroxymethyldihydropteridine diphosphokinase [Cyclobacteriaceae bacterium]|nr:2-amino-4-hydroxy-6-hydroxymethyldihydropteridine diphosphokinase [Cyclobacteriaceae bacterium]